MDYCECLLNNELAKNLLNFIKQYTRQYCTENECPVDGNPRGGDQQGSNPASQHFQMLMLFLMLLGIFMSMMNKSRRNRDEINEKVTLPNRQGDSNDRNPPPSGPSVN